MNRDQEWEKVKAASKRLESQIFTDPECVHECLKE